MRHRVLRGSPRTLLLAAAFVLISIQLLRLLAIVPDWLAGVAPSYPGKYESRASSALTGISIMLGTVVNMWPGQPTRSRYTAAAVLLICACVGIYWELQLP